MTLRDRQSQISSARELGEEQESYASNDANNGGANRQMTVSAAVRLT
jgi:hypothetical protein